MGYHSAATVALGHMTKQDISHHFANLQQGGTLFLDHWTVRYLLGEMADIMAVMLNLCIDSKLSYL